MNFIDKIGQNKAKNDQEDCFRSSFV